MKVEVIIPEDINDLTLEQWSKYELFLDTIAEEDNSIETQYIAMEMAVATFTNLSLKQIRPNGKNPTVSREALSAIATDVLVVLNSPIQTTDYYKGGKKYVMCPELTEGGLLSGRYIDAEQAIINGDYVGAVSALTITGTEYTGDSLEDIPLGYGKTVLEMFAKYRSKVVETYADLYVVDEGLFTVQSTHLDGYGSKWGWLAKIDALAGGNLQTWDVILSYPIEKVMLKLLLDKEKNDAMEKDRQTQERMQSV